MVLRPATVCSFVCFDGFSFDGAIVRRQGGVCPSLPSLQLCACQEMHCSASSQSGWHKLWQAGRRPARTSRIFEDREVNQGILSRSEAVLNPQSSVVSRQSSVLSPQFSVLSPQYLAQYLACKLCKCGTHKIRKHWFCVARMLTTALFPTRNSVYGIFVMNDAKISTYAFWGRNYMLRERFIK